MFVADIVEQRIKGIMLEVLFYRAQVLQSVVGGIMVGFYQPYPGEGGKLIHCF